MNSKSWSRVKSLFFAASNLDPADRSGYLARQPNVGSQVRDQVKEMLADRDAAGTFLNAPAAGPTPDETEFLDVVRAQLADGDMVCGRYRIRRYIARGGMGEVYEADDLEMEIVVAIKILRPEVFGGADLVARFKREIDLARRVSHPNIGRIHDIGHYLRPDGHDIPFLTMEFLEGETLAQRISRGGPISEEEARPLIRDMVRALDAIHQNGIVHRDFKSSNVMLVVQPNGKLCARVMDFGLARPTTPGNNTLTRDGSITGTPAYMAPEQFEGISTPASDVYAVGVVIHEMLTGARPTSQAAEATGRIPLEWAPIVRCCLAIRPLERFQTAGQLLEALPKSAATSQIQPVAKRPRWRPWISIAIVMLLLAGTVIWAVARRGSSISTAEPAKHLALLPIQSESVDPLDGAFCAGFSDTLRGDLAEMETASKDSLWVIPSAEVRGIRTASQAYREVGANLVLAATLHRARSGVSLTAELVDPKNLHLLKSVTIEADTLPALREAAVARMAALLDVKVGVATAREVADSSTSAPGAFEFYEQGLGYLQGDSVKNADQAIALFKKALDKDKNFALAYAGLGEAYASKYEGTKDPRWVNAAVVNGQKAIKLNSGLAQVHSIMGVTYRLTGHSDLALAELKKAVELEPSCMRCFHHLGDAYSERGQFDDAERSFATIVRNQRGSVIGYSGLAKVADLRGDLPKAAEMYRHALDLAPDSPRAAANLGGVYIEMGRYQEAVPLLRKSLAVEPSGETYSNLGAGLMYLSRFEEAADAMEHAVQLEPDNHDFWRNLGDSYRQVPALRSKADGAYENALKRAQVELAIKPGDADLLSSVGLYYAHLGDKNQADSFTAQALTRAPKNASVLFTAALSAEITGNRKNAINLVARSAKAGYPLALIEQEPELASLRTDPDYRKWIEQARSSNVRSH